jgi:hypothetical protein
MASTRIAAWILLVAAAAACIHAPDIASARNGNNINNHNHNIINHNNNNNNNNNNNHNHNNKDDNDWILCPSITEAVFPFRSLCIDPATYWTPYLLQSEGQGAGSGYYLAPEWDETNATYYVRLVNSSEAAATYRFAYMTRELRPFIAVGDSGIYAENTESGLSLAWRDEGGELFLTETAIGPGAKPGFTRVRFSFSFEGSLQPFCRNGPLERCAAYSVVDDFNSSLGLSPYEEDGAVYFTLASDPLPFVLLTTQSPSLASPRVNPSIL